MQMDTMKSHESVYDDDDELPPINGGGKLKPSKYTMGKQATKSGQGTSLYGGSTSTSLKPKGIAPVGNGSGTNRSGVYQDSMSTFTKASTKAPSGNTMAQLPLKKMNVAPKPKKFTGAIPSSIGVGSSSSSSFGDVSVGGASLFLNCCIVRVCIGGLTM